VTEREWLRCDEPSSMVSALHERHLRRKHLLFLCECFRRTQPAHPDGVRATELLERYADGEADFQEVARLNSKLGKPGKPAWPLFDNGIGCTADFWKGEFGQFHAAWQTASAIVGAATARKPGRPSKTAIAERERTRAALKLLVRCVYGNPFRPVPFETSWRTDTVLSLAGQMYDSRDFGAMPILADALQDVGCDNEEVLNHCRGETTHARGCWVVDLVLGKE
jgi:hypothetical protein